MQYDENKVDEMILALLFLGASKTPGGARASKGFDLRALSRLREKGYIAELSMKSLSLELTPDGIQKAEELFSTHFGAPSSDLPILGK